MRIILVHGFNASPQDNFHPWLADTLRDMGFEVETPELPLSTKDPLDLPKIIEAMKDQVGYLKSDDILLGHSLGAFIILQYLEAVEMTETPRAVVLVAAPWKVSRQELKQLFIADLDADVLMWKAQDFFVVHSKDDELVPFEHGERLAKQLKAKLLAVDKQGHFMGERYSILAEILKRIAEKPVEYDPGGVLDDDYANLQE